MFRKSGKALTIAAIALFYLTACEKAETNTPVENASTLQLYLTDSPADYGAVWITIQKVMVHLSGDTAQEDGWQELPISNSGRYNLLHLRNGADTLLASSDVPAGSLSEIKLMLGQNNSIVLKNGDSADLLIPSGSSPEISLEVENVSLQPGAPFELVLDFDLAHSIHEPPLPDSGQYYLDPVIHVFAKGAGASIQGWVAPDSAQAHILAIRAGDTLSAIPDSPGGFFKFWGIPEGQYTLLFIADTATGYQNDTLSNIQAVEGEVFQTDTVRLHQ